MKTLFKKLLHTNLAFLLLFSNLASAVDTSSIVGVDNQNTNYPQDYNSTTSTNTQMSATNQFNMQNTQNTQNMQDPTTNPQNPLIAPYTNLTPILPPIFGAHLFNGNFTKASQSLYNPDYKIAVGDRINFRMWGAVNFNQELMVDSQGNVFIPNVGAINILGVRNGDLVKVLKRGVSKIYKNNVFIYADMNVYQNVSVFVTGNVNKPGLYQGLSSDSVVQYIDKAGGINLDYGSFRDIEILRNNKAILQIDLYNFLLSGQIKLFPFRNGDVILVKNLQSYAYVSGDVQKPFRFELKDDIKTLQDLAIVAGAKPTTTHATIRSYNANRSIEVASYESEEFANIPIKAGDEVEFRPDYNAKKIAIRIEGEHSGLHSLVVKKGTTLAEVIAKIKPNDQSNMDAIQVFRKSVATTQKKLIQAQLKELETLALTSSSVTPQEATMRSAHSKMVLEFIERAKNIEPKGQIVIENKLAYHNTILEEGDIINIPAKSNLVLVQGEVALPGAFVYEEGKSLQYYINLAGDFTERANKKRILLIRANGKAERYNGSWYALSSTPGLKPGDSLLILPAIETGRGLQITSVLTQILYQIAIATKVVLDINDNK
ncbi:polysaccharide biosynthesis/export family protein [Helicobacter burdigaliensis]|uniref:polysaccharide biosynthesis/export family protein n=1 Tax=Helicobacter burdigaliensis TaxID=2315334 RepID=UPI000EF72351|nr:polysaccharide biosynthesis/export family protein [Helicobacter burdigaliensis]